MDIKILKDVLGSDFKPEVEESLKFKYKENILEIGELKEEQEKLNEKLRNIYKSIGLENCASNMDEIDLLNEKLKQIDISTNMVNYYNDWIKEYESQVIKIKNGEITSFLSIEDINNIIDDFKKRVTLEKQELKRYGSKTEIKKQIADLHNGITQSMIVLIGEEDRDIKEQKIIDVYKENADLEAKILKLVDDNLKISKVSKELGFDLDYVTPVVNNINNNEHDEKIAENLGLPVDKLDDVKNIHIIRDFVNENPEVLDEDDTWDKAEEDGLTEEKSNKKAVEQPKEIQNINISRPSNEVEVLTTEEPKQQQEIASYKDNYKTAIVRKADEINDNGLYKQKLESLAQEGPITRTIDPYVDYEKLEIDRHRKFEESLKEPNKLNNSAEIIDNKLNKNRFLNFVTDKIEKMNHTNNYQKPKIDVDDILMDYYSISKEELYNLTEEDVINLVAGYLNVDPSNDLIMTDEEFIEKIADRLNISVKELNTMSVDTINTVIKKINKKESLNNENIVNPISAAVDEIRNSKLIKRIGKLSKDLSDKLMNKARLSIGTIKDDNDPDINLENDFGRSR